MKKNSFSVAMGDNLKALRKSRDLSAAELAEIIGITPDDVRKYERGERAMTVEKMIAFSVALNCSPQNMIEGLDPRTGGRVGGGEIRMMSADEHRIMMHLATDWDGDRRALIIASGIYMAIPPHRRREIIMALEMQKDEAVRLGEISADDLPSGVEYMQKALGELYTI